MRKCVLYPDIKYYYNFDKNDNIDLSNTFPTSRKNAFWICKKCNQEFYSRIDKSIKTGFECPRCFHKGRPSSRQMIPVSSDDELTEHWDYDENKKCGIDIQSTSISSKDPVFWKCKTCNSKWTLSPFQMKKRSIKCLTCAKQIKNGGDLLTLLPELAETYDSDANEIDGIDYRILGIHSDIKVHWKCNECGYRWVQSVRHRVYYNKTGDIRITPCQNCKSLHRRMTSYDKEYPELLQYYDEDLNSRPLSTIKGTERSLKLWWTCKTCGNSFQSTVGRMIRGLKKSTKGCPFCSKQRFSAIHKSFADANPELMDEYDPENVIDAHTVFPSNETVVMWICRNDPQHKWTASFWARHKGYANCPICETTKAKTTPGINSFEDIYPELLKYWSPRNERTPTDVRYDLRDRILWFCPECGGEYSKLVSEFVANPNDCPYCNDRKPLPGFNTLAVKYPELAAMWASDNYTDADHVLPSSTLRSKWKCPECSGLYYASPKEIIAGDVTCPYCNDRKPLLGFNTLAVKYPELAAMWASDNYTDADHVLPSSSLKAKWKCPECSGIYYASPKDIIAGDVSCPYCNDRKPLPGYNTFAVRHPDSLVDWDYVNNYVLADPDQILPTSTTKVWWTCHNDPSHHYPQRVCDRVMFDKRHRGSCPYCKGRRIKKRHFV